MSLLDIFKGKKKENEEPVNHGPNFNSLPDDVSALISKAPESFRNNKKNFLYDR